MEPAGQAIKTMREALGLTLAELARRAECDPAYLGRVERGEREPSKYFVAHLAEVLAESDGDAA